MNVRSAVPSVVPSVVASELDICRFGSIIGYTEIHTQARTHIYIYIHTY